MLNSQTSSRLEKITQIFFQIKKLEGELKSLVSDESFIETLDTGYERKKKKENALLRASVWHKHDRKKTHHDYERTIEKIERNVQERKEICSIIETHKHVTRDFVKNIMNSRGFKINFQQVSAYIRRLKEAGTVVEVSPYTYRYVENTEKNDHVDYTESIDSKLDSVSHNVLSGMNV